MSVKISELPFNNAYTGSERILIVQDTVTRAGTLSSFATYLSSFYYSPVVSALSSNWNDSYTIVTANSSNWDEAYTLVDISPTWSSTYSNVKANSGSWSSVYSNVNANSGSWNESYSNVKANSGSWSSVYSNVNANSASYALDTTVLKLTGGNISGNLTITGNLTASGTSYFANTIYSTTSALSIINVGNTGTALYVSNNGLGDLASFYDVDSGVEALHIGGINGSNPYTGIRTSTPNKELTVNGQISASNIIWDSNGNSNDWNSVYSRVRTLSSTWSGVTTVTNYLSTNNVLLSSATILDTLSAKAYINNPTGKTIIVDGVVGTDTRTGISKYDQFKPFSTIEAAVLASATGDLIYVRAGSYTIASSINLNTKGHLYFELGAEVTISTGVTAFIYSQNSYAIDIRGHANFITIGTATILNISSGNTSTTVSLECNNITSTTGNGTLFVVAAGSFTINARLINAASATVFNISGEGSVIAQIRFVYCNTYLISTGTANSRITSDIWQLDTSNTTSGMTITSIGSANFRILNYNHIGVGVVCSWTQNAQTESITFIDTRWLSSANLSHITTTTTAGSMSTKTIKLRGVNTLTGISTSTNSISSAQLLNVYVQNSYASTAANSNVIFKVGTFTVDTDTNNF